MPKMRIISDSSEPFASRKEAGLLLAYELRKYRAKNNIVCGIPRGGVIVAGQITETLDADLDIVLAHKLGAPGNPELAIGAVTEQQKVFIDKEIAAYAGADEHYINQEKTFQFSRLTAGVQKYRKILPKLALKNRIVILTDDGVATGATMQAALWALRQEKPEKIIAALPIGPADTIKKLSETADETLCLKAPPFFMALSQFYTSFEQVDDQILMQVLQQENLRRKKAQKGD